MTGKEFEQRLCILLQKQGCTLARGPVRPPGKARLCDSSFSRPPASSRHSTWSAITHHPVGDDEKRAKFLKAVRGNPCAKRNVYLELHPSLKLEDGGAFITMVALASYAFDKRYADVNLIGILVNSDLSYSFFAFDDRRPEVPRLVLPPLRSPQPQAVPTTQNPAPETFDGTVVCYHPGKKIGRVLAVDGQDFFLHRNNVVEQELLDELEVLAEQSGWLAAAVPVGSVPVVCCRERRIRLLSMFVGALPSLRRVGAMWARVFSEPARDLTLAAYLEYLRNEIT